MSRYTPFQLPPAHTRLVQHPTSPPETEDTAVESAPQSEATFEHKPRTMNHSVEFASPLSHRRTPSSVFYKPNDGLREPQAPRKAHRWLLVVIPPPILTQDYQGLSDRPLSHAVMLPLFPSMYSQLVAIAKEFGLPSTTGLRVYLHMPDSGAMSSSLTPRISEDVWPLVWSHLFPPSDEHSNTLLPIGGKIEFDIDMRAAKWFPAWTRSRVLDQTSTHMGEEEGAGSISELSLNADPKSSHIRQLSLLERRPSARSGLHPLNTGSGLRTLITPSQRRRESSASPPENVIPPLLAEAAAQIVSQDSRSQVESMVEKWRAQTPVVPSMVISPPPPIETVPTPTQPVQTPRSTVEIQDLNLDDFTWSISSAGPPSYDPLEPLSPSSDLFSLDLGIRVAGSVLLTPSTATSWGPPMPLDGEETFRYGIDMETILDRHNDHFFYRQLKLDMTPDLGARAIEDVPLTPSTATSWGPPDDDFEHDPSGTVYMQLHDGQRTPDMGERMLSPGEPFVPLRFTSERREVTYPLGWPYVDYQSSSPIVVSEEPSVVYSLAWPYVDYQSSHQGVKVDVVSAYPDFVLYPPASAHTIITRLPSAYPSLSIYTPVYPFNLNHIYPSVIPSERTSTSKIVPPTGLDAIEGNYPHNLLSIYPPSLRNFAVTFPKTYPHLVIYSPVYPFNLNHIYPSVTPEQRTSTSKSHPLTSVSLDVVGCNYPHNLLSIYPPSVRNFTVSFPKTYPNLVIYSPVYPHNLSKIYPPALVQRAEGTRAPLRVWLPAQYPNLVIYRPGYPANLDLIYPSTKLVDRSMSRKVELPVSYPNLQVYKPVYPFNLDSIYPGTQKIEVASRAAPSSATVAAVSPRPSRSGYPYFQLYPAVYPHFDLYPRIVPVVPSSGDKLPKRNVSQYPYFELYPAIYPNFSLYPKVAGALSKSQDQPQKREFSQYPYFELYPAVYPNFSLYPKVAGAISVPKLVTPLHKSNVNRVSADFSSKYPYLRLYKDVYPSIVIYPRRAGECEPHLTVDVKVPSRYPYLRLYKPVYPHFEIYPSVAASRNVRHRRGLSLELDPMSRKLSSVAPSSEEEAGYPPSATSGELTNEEQYLDESAAAMNFRRSILASAFSFTDNHEFEIQQADLSDDKRSPRELSLADILDVDSDVEDQRLQEMDSPTRRFYLARKMDLQASEGKSDDDEDSIYEEEEEEFESGQPEVESIPITIATTSATPPRRSRSLWNDTNQRRSFFEDDDDEVYGEDDAVENEAGDEDGFDEDEFEMGDDELYEAYRDSRPTRFPRPTLSDVAEERSPFSAHYPTTFPLSGGRMTGSFGVRQ